MTSHQFYPFQLNTWHCLLFQPQEKPLVKIETVSDELGKYMYIMYDFKLLTAIVCSDVFSGDQPCGAGIHHFGISQPPSSRVDVKSDAATCCMYIWRWCSWSLVFCPTAICWVSNGWNQEVNHHWWWRQWYCLKCGILTSSSHSWLPQKASVIVFVYWHNL
jgi:hypothetical protein